MKKINKSPLAAAMGAAFISTLAASPANAETNPFGLSELSSGYMQVAAAEMACGANMDMTKSKAPEGACAGKPTKAADKPAAAPAAKPAAEGSCGEGMCGGMMQGDKMKSGMEHSCGAMMKGKDGACGAVGNTKDDGQTKVSPAQAAGKADEHHDKAGLDKSLGKVIPYVPKK